MYNCQKQSYNSKVNFWIWPGINLIEIIGNCSNFLQSLKFVLVASPLTTYLLGIAVAWLVGYLFVNN